MYLCSASDIGTPSVKTGLTNDIYLTLENAESRPGGDRGDDPRVHQAARPVAVDRRRDHGRRHAAGGVPRLAAAGARPTRCRRRCRRRRAELPRRRRSVVERRRVDASITMLSPARGPAQSPPFVALAIAVVLAGLFVVFARCRPVNRARRADTPPTRPAPAPDADRELGRRHAFDAHPPRGRWVVLNFFDLELRAVRAGTPRPRRLRRQQAALGTGRRAELYTVVWDDQRPAVEAVLRRRGRRLAGRLSTTASIATRFGVGQGPRDVDHRPQRLRARPSLARVTRRVLAVAAAACCGSDSGDA